MNRELLYISNQISLLRILLIIPTVYLLLYKPEESYSTAIIIVLLVTMYITDLLDGYLARRLDQVSETGKILDPLADKIVVVAIVLILFLQHKIETWFFVIVITRDIMILIFGLYLKSRKRIVLMSNYPGKAAVLSIGIIMLLTIINTQNTELLDALIRYMYYVSVMLILYSLILYFMRFKKSIGDKSYDRQ
ncbi:MAG: CDP-alcohol phosphatidyltransferase family protein [Ignavibacteriae bacterium]|nr:CDP-alcohol phosphatidyltransferase family protein [Ignavibacteriota bacterium]